MEEGPEDAPDTSTGSDISDPEAGPLALHRPSKKGWAKPEEPADLADAAKRCKGHGSHPITGLVVEKAGDVSLYVVASKDYADSLTSAHLLALVASRGLPCEGFPFADALEQTEEGQGTKIALVKTKVPRLFRAEFVGADGARQIHVELD